MHGICVQDQKIFNIHILTYNVNIRELQSRNFFKILLKSDVFNNEDL